MRILLNKPHEAIRFFGAPDVAYEPDGCRVLRIMRKYHALMPHDIREACEMASGVRLSFQTTSSTVAIALETFKTGITGIVPERLDILAYGERVLNADLQPASKQVISARGLGSSSKRIDIYMPQAAIVRLFHVDIDDGAKLSPIAENEPVWITYGSSITHCGDSDGPSTTWPALVARRLGLNLYNQGFGSNGMMDACSARTIADIPASRISLKLAVNALANTYSDRGFVSAALNMILTIRDRQPDVPILVVSPICFPGGESTPNAVGMTLQRMRELDQEVVERMQNFGDRHIGYLDGLRIFGPADAHLLDLPAAIHPNAVAQFMMAERFASEAYGSSGFLKL